MRAIEQAQLLQRKAAQDLAVLRKLIGDPAISDETLGFHAQQAAEKLIKALLALGGHEYPRTHDLGLLLDLLASLDVQIPEALLTVEILTPFATVFRYDDLPLEAAIDRQEWLPLLLALEEFVGEAIAAATDPFDPP
jgi:HEPN domain-containing protein